MKNSKSTGATSSTGKTQISTLTLPFTLTGKTRGASSADGKNASYYLAQRRLTLGAYWYNLGFRAGAAGVNEKGAVCIHLVKTGYNHNYTSYHAEQHFITITKNNPALEVLAKKPLTGKTRHFTVSVISSNENEALLELA